jgi:hypothetical protein
MANLIADHKKGATWNGFSVTLKEETFAGSGILVPIDLSGCVIVSQFKTTPKGGVIFEFKTSDNSITIPTPANGKFIYMPIASLNYPALNYSFDWKVIYPNGTIVYSPSFNFKIIQTITS